MALYRLATDVMSALSKTWLGARRMELQAISQTSTILPILESAHKGLAPFLGREQEPSGARETLKKQYEVDEQHDDFYRAGFYYFNARASLASALGEEAEAQSCIAMRDLLYPDALFGVTRSYEEEEDAAETLSGRLTPELKERLRVMLVKEGVSMLTVIERQIERAAQLGALEKQKRALQDKEPQGPSLGDERRARYDWIEAARMLERTLRLAVRQKATTEAVINLLLADVRKEEADADRRYLTGHTQ